VLYYDLLVSKLKVRFREVREKELQEYNSQFNFLKQKLIEYLSKIEIDYENHHLNNFMYNLVNKASQPFIDVNTSEINIKNIKFVSFNYTPILPKSLVPFLNGKSIIPSIEGKFSISQIHGRLGDDDSIIFGYGDELDGNYQRIESERSKELFKNIKSIHYLKNKEYTDLRWFLESDWYDVHILGHSCGLSDRTLLNYIFENDYCKSIKIYHHNNDFFEKGIEISRCFKDKNDMRKKIQPYNVEDEIPQFLGN